MATLDAEKRIFDLPSPLDADALECVIDLLTSRYPALACTDIGRSILDRPLRRLTIGEGKSGAVLVGGMSGTDRITPALLLRFVNEYCDLHARGGRIFGYNLRYLTELRRTEILPMLNPDGVGYSTGGVAEDHLLRPRLLGMNRGLDAFDDWQANARGVDLRLNFAPANPIEFTGRKQTALAGEYPGGGPFGWCGEAPESEPESAALTAFLRACPHAGMLIILSVGEKNAVCCPVSAQRCTLTLGRNAARLCGLPLLTDCTSPLCTWASAELGIPAIEIRFAATGDLFSLYTALRELLFVAPTLPGR